MATKITIIVLFTILFTFFLSASCAVTIHEFQESYIEPTVNGFLHVADIPIKSECTKKYPDECS